MKSRIEPDKPFLIKGKWNLPGSELKTTGTLSFDDKFLDLDLQGGLTAPKPLEGAIRDASPQAFPVIHGTSEDSVKCTLMKTYISKETADMFSGQVSKLNLSGSHLFSGAFLEDSETQTFDKMTVRFTHLNSFVGVRSFGVERSVNDDGLFNGVKASCAIPSELSVDVDAINANLTVDQNVLACEPNRSRLELEIETRVLFTPDVPQTLDWFLTKIWRFCYLLTLLTNENPQPSGIEYSIPDGGDRSNGWLVSNASIVAKESRPQTLLLFHLPHISDNLKYIFETWYGASETLVDSFHLFMNAKRNEGDQESRLLLLAHGLEAFTRVIGGSKYMEEQAYEKVVQEMNSAIPQSVVDGHRASMKNRIRFGNEFSLRKRLTGLLNSLDEQTLEHICKSKTQFIGGVVSTRNYHSHYTDDLRKNALNGRELAWACNKLEMLFRVLLLKHVGIDETLVRQRIEGNHLLGQWKRIWNNVKESVE